MFTRTRSLLGAATFVALLTTACSDVGTNPTSAPSLSVSSPSFAKGSGGGGAGGVVVPAVGPLSGTWVLSSPVSTLLGQVTLTLNAAGTSYTGDMFFGFPELGLGFANKPYTFRGGYNPDGSIVFGYSPAGGKPGIQPTLLINGILSADGLTITGSSTAFWPGASFTMTKL